MDLNNPIDLNAPPSPDAMGEAPPALDSPILLLPAVNPPAGNSPQEPSTPIAAREAGPCTLTTACNMEPANTVSNIVEPTSTPSAAQERVCTLSVGTTPAALAAEPAWAKLTSAPCLSIDVATVHGDVGVTQLDDADSQLEVGDSQFMLAGNQLDSDATLLGQAVTLLERAGNLVEPAGGQLAAGAKELDSFNVKGEAPDSALAINMQFSMNAALLDSCAAVPDTATVQSGMAAAQSHTATVRSDTDVDMVAAELGAGHMDVDPAAAPSDTVDKQGGETTVTWGAGRMELDAAVALRDRSDRQAGTAAARLAAGFIELHTDTGPLSTSGGQLRAAAAHQRTSDTQLEPADPQLDLIAQCNDTTGATLDAVGHGSGGTAEVEPTAGIDVDISPPLDTAIPATAAGLDMHITPAADTAMPHAAPGLFVGVSSTAATTVNPAANAGALLAQCRSASMASQERLNHANPTAVLGLGDLQPPPQHVLQQPPQQAAPQQQQQGPSQQPPFSLLSRRKRPRTDESPLQGEEPSPGVPQEGTGLLGRVAAAVPCPLLQPAHEGSQAVQLPRGYRCTPAVLLLLQSTLSTAPCTIARRSKGSSRGASHPHITVRGLPQKWASSAKVSGMIRDSIVRFLESPDEAPAMQMHGGKKKGQAQQVVSRRRCEEGACLAVLQGTWYTEQEFLEILEQDPTQFQTCYSLRNWRPGISLYLDFSQHLSQPLQALFGPSGTENAKENMELVDGDDMVAGVPFVAILARKALPVMSVLGLPRTEARCAAMACALQRQCAVLSQQEEELRVGWERLQQVYIDDGIPLPSWLQSPPPWANTDDEHHEGRKGVVTKHGQSAGGQTLPDNTTEGVTSDKDREPCWLAPAAAKLMNDWKSPGQALIAGSAFVEGLEISPHDVGGFDAKVLLQQLRKRLDSGQYRHTFAELPPHDSMPQPQPLKVGPQVMGAFASCTMEAGAIVGLYPGEVMTEAEYEDHAAQAQTEHMFGVEVVGFERELGVLIVDGSKRLHALREINHYQDLLGQGAPRSPNVHYVPVLDHQRRMVYVMVVTKERVEAGDELLLDFGSQYFQLMVPGLLDERDELQQKVTRLLGEVEALALDLDAIGVDVQVALAGAAPARK